MINYRIILFTFILLASCEHHHAKIEYSDNFEFYSNKGFALIYEDIHYKNKLINKKLEERSLIVLNNKLKENSSVKITNLINGKELIATVGEKSIYPQFYNSVISIRIAKTLNLDLNEPYIQIETLNSNNTFVAGKAKTYDEEKKVATKAPVDSITIKNIGISTPVNKTKKIIKASNFNYIIKFADLYFEDSANMLKERLFNEFNIKNVSIKKFSNNEFRVYIGPYNNLDVLKNAFDKVTKTDFENIEIIKL